MLLALLHAYVWSEIRTTKAMGVSGSLTIPHKDYFHEFWESSARSFWKMIAHFRESGRPQGIPVVVIIDIGAISIS